MSAEHEAPTVPLAEAITEVRRRLALMSECAGLKPKKQARK